MLTPNSAPLPVPLKRRGCGLRGSPAAPVVTVSPLTRRVVPPPVDNTGGGASVFDILLRGWCGWEILSVVGAGVWSPRARGMPCWS